MLANCRAGRLGGDAQRLHQLAVVDLVVLRGKQRAGDFAGKMRLARPGGGGRQPFERQIELTLKLQALRDLGLIVRGQGEMQDALAPQFDIDAARPQKFLGKGRPARLALAAERDQRFFAGLGFAASRQHAGSRVAGARSGLAAIEHRDRGAAGQPPGDTQADDAGADDGDTRPTIGMIRLAHAAPFAGMIQTGSTGVISAAKQACAPAQNCRRDTPGREPQ